MLTLELIGWKRLPVAGGNDRVYRLLGAGGPIVLRNNRLKYNNAVKLAIIL